MYSAPKNLGSLADDLTVVLQKHSFTRKQLEQFHARILAGGLLHSPPLLTMFLPSCYRSQEPHYALLFMRNLLICIPSLWNSTVRLSLDSGLWPDFVGLYNGLIRNNVFPSETGLLNFYGRVGDLRWARKMFAEMLQGDVVADNAMVSAFSKHGCVEAARDLFDNMQQRNSASWNSLAIASRVILAPPVRCLMQTQSKMWSLGMR